MEMGNWLKYEREDREFSRFVDTLPVIPLFAAAAFFPHVETMKVKLAILKMFFAFASAIFH